MTATLQLLRQREPRTEPIRWVDNSEGRTALELREEHGAAPITPATQGLIEIARLATSHGWRILKFDLRDASGREPQEEVEERARELRDLVREERMTEALDLVSSAGYRVSSVRLRDDLSRQQIAITDFGLVQAPTAAPPGPLFERLRDLLHDWLRLRPEK